MKKVELYRHNPVISHSLLHDSVYIEISPEYRMDSRCLMEMGDIDLTCFIDTSPLIRCKSVISM
jgi:hypothetical protein